VYTSRDIRLKLPQKKTERKKKKKEEKRQVADIFFSNGGSKDLFKRMNAHVVNNWFAAVNSCISLKFF